LFQFEREAKSFEHLKKLRLEKSKLLLEELEKLLMAELPRSRGESQKRKAIEYALNWWPGLGLFIEDSRIPLSNSEAERTIRHAVMGRKIITDLAITSGPKRPPPYSRSSSRQRKTILIPELS
jgi:hypothetical protein